MYGIWGMVIVCIECQETPGRLKSRAPNMVNHFARQSPLLFLLMYDACTRSKKIFRIFILSDV